MKNKIISFITFVIIVLGYLIFYKYKIPFFKKSSNLVVINVLDKNFYDDCHIKGSIGVPFIEFEDYAKKLNKDKEVVVYCSNYMCTASFSAARILKKLGFKKVYAYEAGMAEWKQNNLPTEGSCKESYLNVKVEKPESKENNDVQHITTQELSEKIKKEFNI